MATKRMINKSISISEQVNDLNLKAALLFTWMIPHADDFGIMPGSPKKVKALVVPMRDDICINDVESALKDMSQAGLIYWYEFEGVMYVQFPKWDEHQSGLHKRTNSRFPTYQKAVEANNHKALEADIKEVPVSQNTTPQVDNTTPFPGTSGNFRETSGNSGSTEQNRTEQNRTEYNIYSSQPKLATPNQMEKSEKIKSVKKKQTKKQKAQPLYSVDSVEFGIASKMRNGILCNLPGAKVPDETVDQLAKWCHDINMMIRIDKRAPDEIERVMDFALTDSFWMSNILSPSKLRKQFDTLVLQMNRSKKGDCVNYGKRNTASRSDIEQFMVT